MGPYVAYGRANPKLRWKKYIYTYMKLYSTKGFSKIYYFTFSQNIKASVALWSVLFGVYAGKTKAILCTVNCQNLQTDFLIYGKPLFISKSEDTKSVELECD